MSRPIRTVVIYTDAGGGHKATAEAIRSILTGAGGFEVILVNPYREIFPELDVFSLLTDSDGERIYNEQILGRGRTGLFCLAYYALAALGIRFQAARGRRALGRYFDGVRPDLVISVMPLINRQVVDGLRDCGGALGKAPCVVLLTDWVETHRHVWFPRGRDYHAICGTEPGYRQLTRDGARAKRVYRTSGLLIRSEFLHEVPSDKAQARRALGLRPDMPLACMLYGGGGSWRMHDLALALRERPLAIQMIFLCGRNRELAESLSAMEWPFPVRVLGFTPDVHRYLGMADIFIGKPGPGSVSEALALRLSLLLDRRVVLPQERPLLRWIGRQGLGHAFSTPAELRRRLEAHCACPAPVVNSNLVPPNRASDELPGVLAEILAQP